jgi:translation initiation factor 2 beta subunit (eIF-2beta)/eIF-5
MQIPIPNTCQNQFDPSYRYMRDSLKISKQGQFYVFENIEQVGEQLNVTIDKIKSYLTSKLGQPIIVDKKTKMMKIKNLPSNFEECFESFIETYVICKDCKKPELDDKRVCKCCGETN